MATENKKLTTLGKKRQSVAKKRVNVYLSDSTLEKLDKYAEKEEITRSYALEVMLQFAFSHKGKKTKIIKG